MRPYSVLRLAGFIGLYFVAIPVALAGLNDWLAWPRLRAPAVNGLGVLVLTVGLGICAYCGFVFRTRGHGTPVPSEPPTELVGSGLYRISRNPMYVGYVSIGVGVFLMEGQALLALYPVLLFALAQAYLVKIEEPLLRSRFGAAYEDYCRRVPRWPWSRRAA